MLAKFIIIVLIPNFASLEAGEHPQTWYEAAQSTVLCLLASLVALNLTHRQQTSLHLKSSADILKLKHILDNPRAAI